MAKEQWLKFHATIEILIEDVEETEKNEAAMVNQIRKSLAQGKAYIRAISKADTQQQVEMDCFRIPPVNTSSMRGIV